jgi:hypothetical protein
MGAAATGLAMAAGVAAMGAAAARIAGLATGWGGGAGIGAAGVGGLVAAGMGAAVGPAGIELGAAAGTVTTFWHFVQRTFLPPIPSGTFSLIPQLGQEMIGIRFCSWSQKASLLDELLYSGGSIYREVGGEPPCACRQNSHAVLCSRRENISRLNVVPAARLAASESGGEEKRALANRHRFCHE